MKVILYFVSNEKEVDTLMKKLGEDIKDYEEMEL